MIKNQLLLTCFAFMATTAFGTSLGALNPLTREAKENIANNSRQLAGGNAIENISSNAIISPNSKLDKNTVTPGPKKGTPQKEMTIPEDAEYIFDQDFSLLTEGTEDEPGPSLLPSTITSIDDYFISAEYMGEDGWLGMGVRSAGGCIALTEPTPYGYNNGGILDTPDHELYGRVFIKFRAKVIPSSDSEKDPSAGFFVSCAIDKLAPYPQGVNNLGYGQPGAAVGYFNLKASDGWQDIEMMVYNPYEGEDCFVQINCSYPDTGLLVDDFIVRRDYEFCLPPSNLISYNFTNDGFTARWDPGKNNISYLLTLIEQVEDGESVSNSVDFDNITVDENGKITSLTDLKGIEVRLQDNRGTIDEGFESSGAVILSSDGDEIILPDLGKPITDCTVYVKANCSPNSYALLYLIGESNGYSQVAGSIPLNQAIEGKVFDLERYMMDFGSYSSLTFQPFYLSEGESVIVDHIQWTISAPFTEQTVFEDRPETNNIVVLTGLNPANEYFFAVKGVSPDGMISQQTAFKQALGCPPPAVTGATEIDLDNGSYTANWVPSVKARSYEVSNYEMRTMTEDIEDYTIIYDDFENASDPDGMGVELNGSSFDGLADNNGWTSSVGIYSESSIGSYYGFEVVSPYLSLGNDNGRFKVKTQLTSFPGTEIVIQCNITSFQVVTIPYEGNPDELSSEEFELTFDDGTDLTQLMFYAHSSDAFLIQDIEVTQDMKKGDRVLSFLDSEIVRDHDSDSYKFTGLLASDDYDFAYTVQAYGNYMGLNYSSDPSEIMYVNFKESSVKTIENANKVQMYVRDGVLMLSLPWDADVQIYDVAGRMVNNAKGHKGINSITLGNTGVYIVKVNDEVRKVMVNK